VYQVEYGQADESLAGDHDNARAPSPAGVRPAQVEGGETGDTDRQNGPSEFRSDLIDLDRAGLHALNDMPASVLAEALSRIMRELANGDEVLAGFQSSVPAGGTDRDPPDVRSKRA
jgi:FXSXX-COOH protein